MLLKIGWEVACTIEMLVAAVEGTMAGTLHYRNLERYKTWAMAKNQGNYEKLMVLNESSLRDVAWWLSPEV